MQHYRAYFLDQDGHISNAIDMECTDDEQAKECAKKFYLDAMPSFGRMIVLLRCAPRERYSTSPMLNRRNVIPAT